jgi:hypothetical protein
VLISVTDFNGAEDIFSGALQTQWDELENVLRAMPLHVKASDQAGIKGRAIFDPVGTNHYLKSALSGLGWGTNISIPYEYAFLGTDVDFFKAGLLVEAQFSTYAFLPNNMLRSELFFKAGTLFQGAAVQAIAVITKGRMFPAANSTLYYEQAVSQLSSLAKHKLFEIPLRVVGLVEKTGTPIIAKLTKYHNARYSRTVVTQLDHHCIITPGKKARRCFLELAIIADDQPPKS